MGYFGTQRQVTLRSIVRSGRIYNASEILCIKFGEDPIKMIALYPGQHLPHYKSIDAQGRVLKIQ